MKTLHPPAARARLTVTRSWFVAVGATLVALAAGVYPFILRAPTLPAVWLCAAVTAALYFAGLLLHELGHALVARRCGVPVAGITLRGLGGMTQRPNQWQAPAREIAIALAGPVVSLALGLLCLALALTAPFPEALQLVLAWGGLMQLATATVNALPLRHLDGARVLRSVVAATGRQRQRRAVGGFWAAWAALLLVTVGATSLARGL